MFLQVSVILSTGGGVRGCSGGVRAWLLGGRAWQRGGHAWRGGVRGMHPPPRYGRSLRGRYASYWNAFLLYCTFVMYRGAARWLPGAMLRKRSGE